MKKPTGKYVQQKQQQNKQSNNVKPQSQMQLKPQRSMWRHKQRRQGSGRLCVLLKLLGKICSNEYTKAESTKYKLSYKMIIILVGNRMQINNRSSIADPSWLMPTVFLCIPLGLLHLSHTSSPSAGRCFKCPLALFHSLLSLSFASFVDLFVHLFSTNTHTKAAQIKPHNLMAARFIWSLLLAVAARAGQDAAGPHGKRNQFRRA